MPAQIRDRIIKPKAVNQILQWDRLAMAALVTTDVDPVVVIEDVLEGRGDIGLAVLVHPARHQFPYISTTVLLDWTMVSSGNKGREICGYSLRHW